MYTKIVDAVLDYGKMNPDKLAIAFKNDTLTYKELSERVLKAAYILSGKYRLGEGSKVMLSAVSKPEYIVSFLAIQLIGAISIPVDKSSKEKNLEELVRFVEPALVCTDTVLSEIPEQTVWVSFKEFYGNVSAEESFFDYQTHCNTRNKDEIAEILFTTGTTGKPKGAMLSYENVLVSSCYTRDGIGMKQDDVILIPLPLNHSFGMRVLRACLYIGAAVVLQNGFTFAKNIEDNIKKYHCTGMVSAAASMELIERQMQGRFSEVIGSLRYIEFSAGSVSLEGRRRLLKLLPDTEIHNTWGSTETGGAIFLNLSKHPEKIGSIGHPCPGIEMQAVSPDGEVVQARDINTAGRMMLKGPMQMKGYYRMPEITDNTLVNGWLLTSDMVYTDDDGYIYMLGRADDIINVGGEKVSPLEIENIAGEYSKISDCACAGVQDPKEILGFVPVLFVVPSSGYQEDVLRQFLAANLERYKLPQEYIEVPSIPRNRMGKIDRKQLKYMWNHKERTKELFNPVLQNILTRRSIRSFREEAVPKDILEMILKAGRYAPSGHNMQTWHFTVLTRKEDIERLKLLTKETAKQNKVYFYGFDNPACVILVSNDERAPYGCQDCSAAVQNMQLAAHSYGLGSVWINALMTLRKKEPVKSLLDEFDVPENHTIWSCLALGFPSAEGNLLAKKETVYHFVHPESEG